MVTCLRLIYSPYIVVLWEQYLFESCLIWLILSSLEFLFFLDRVQLGWKLSIKGSLTFIMVVVWSIKKLNFVRWQGNFVLVLVKGMLCMVNSYDLRWICEFQATLAGILLLGDLVVVVVCANLLWRVVDSSCSGIASTTINNEFIDVCKRCGGFNLGMSQESTKKVTTIRVANIGRWSAKQRVSRRIRIIREEEWCWKMYHILLTYKIFLPYLITPTNNTGLKKGGMGRIYHLIALGWCSNSGLYNLKRRWYQGLNWLLMDLNFTSKLGVCFLFWDLQFVSWLVCGFVFTFFCLVFCLVLFISFCCLWLKARSSTSAPNLLV